MFIKELPLGVAHDYEGVSTRNRWYLPWREFWEKHISI
jgi:hypothetical protein